MKSKTALAVVCMMFASIAFADTYYLKSNMSNSSDGNPWCAENIWTNASGVAYTIPADLEEPYADDFVVNPGLSFYGRQSQNFDYSSTFPGKSLTVLAVGDKTGMLNPRQATLVIPKLTLDATASTTNESIMIHVNGVGTKPSDLAEDIIVFAGDELEIKTKPDAYAVLDVKGGFWARDVAISASLTGSGNLMLRSRWEVETTDEKNFFLTGDNSRFTGRICVSGFTTTFPDAFLYVSDAKQLGGNPATLQQRGLELFRNANICFTGSCVIDQPNRGLYIDSTDKYSEPYATFTVNENCDVVYSGPWSFNNRTRALKKKGKGSLWFSGGRYPDGNGSWFCVHEGILKLNAQDIVIDETKTAKIQLWGGTLHLGSNGIARVNPDYFRYAGDIELVDAATLEFFKIDTKQYTPPDAVNITVNHELQMTDSSRNKCA